MINRIFGWNMMMRYEDEEIGNIVTAKHKNKHCWGIDMVWHTENWHFGPEICKLFVRMWGRE